VIIDPGYDAVAALDDVLAEYRLQPVAVLLTHGHVDHTWSVTPVCAAKDVPALIHPDDRSMLTDPTGGLGIPSGTPILGRFEWAEPSDVRALSDGETLNLAGLEVAVDAAPGHTRGSVTFRSGDEFFSGDLLFAGSIGRTDLPGGSFDQIQDSLARVALALPDETVVRPGHGPDTTIGRERLINPYLADLPTTRPVTRGL
jgi:hydroxyacylglutathione hydrolase